MQFEKVSYNRFVEDIIKLSNKKAYPDEILKSMYDTVKLPKRSTLGSAGYDFVIPFSVDITTGASIVIPTGIRAVDMPNNVVLVIYPRSGLGFKYRTSLANTVGIIDSDYASSSNEGHIMIKLTYDDFKYTTEIEDITLNKQDDSELPTLSTLISASNTPVRLHFDAGDRFCQGIFTYCLFVDNDFNDTLRDGGFGSTGNS